MAAEAKPAAPAPAPPGPESELLAALLAAIPGAQGKVKRARRIEVTLPKEQLLDAARWLAERTFVHCSSVVGVDRHPKPEMESVAHAWSYEKRMLVSLRVVLPRDSPRVASVTPVWPGANWHEREAWDLLGIAYEGHPGLRRILNPDDWRGHPLRKDEPLPEKKRFITPHDYEAEVAAEIEARRAQGYLRGAEE
ncbi:MAG: NADH-quinone oxidoreductase subunit C [Halobacteria archaeon]